MKVVGVFGVSGVGKTTILNAILAGKRNWSIISAGSLVQELRPSIGRDSLRKLSYEGVRENQEAIVAGMRRIRETAPADLMLFDGHLVIDTGAEVLDVPLDVIARLRLDAIVFIRESPLAIVARRTADTLRVRERRTPAEIATEQHRALHLARSYARNLGLTIDVFRSHEAQELAAFLESVVLNL